MVYLEKQIAKYPKMQTIDILKLYLQGILGPTHLISNYDRLKQNLLNEYNECKDNNITYKLYEQISDEYIRVNLKPFYEKYQSFDKLVDYFKESINLNVDYDYFVSEVKKLINEENKEFITNYLESKNYVVSHSKVYKDEYQPHYLVIKAKFKGEI